MATCRACGNAITFIRTDKGGLMPLNAAANPAGNVILVAGAGGAPVAHVLTAGESTAAPRWMPHHATCPTWPQRKAAGAP